jgi:RimJ/RimL family protein N-acetyltransferase
VLHGDLVSLRELRRDDLPVLHAAVDSDPEVHAVTELSPWRPVTLAQRQVEFDRALGNPPDQRSVGFAVQRRDDQAGRCIGSALLWRIDPHQRTASLGITLTSQARGKGLGRDAVRVLCRYGFDVRGLHRLSLETLATNEAMLATARACGFSQEGVLRENAWVMGRRVDEVLFGLLEPQWRAATGSG